MSKQTQKEAVYTAVTNVLKEAGVEIQEGQSVSTFMNREIRGQVNQILFEGFRAGNVEIDKEYSDKELKNYVSGLQSNWVRKDKRLNGNISYVAKNPGTRVGSNDPQIKAMRGLLLTLTSEEEKAEVQQHIDTRLTEMKVSKVKAVEIDYSALPSDLAAKFSK